MNFKKMTTMDNSKKFKITSGIHFDPTKSMIYADNLLAIKSKLVNAIIKDDVKTFIEEIEKCGDLEQNDKFLGHQEIYVVKYFMSVHNSKKCKEYFKTFLEIKIKKRKI